MRVLVSPPSQPSRKASVGLGCNGARHARTNEHGQPAASSQQPEAATSAATTACQDATALHQGSVAPLAPLFNVSRHLPRGCSQDLHSPMAPARVAATDQRPEQEDRRRTHEGYAASAPSSAPPSSLLHCRHCRHCPRRQHRRLSRRRRVWMRVAVRMRRTPCPFRR